MLINSLFLVMVGLLLFGGLLSFFFGAKPKLSINLGFTGAALASLIGIGLSLWLLLGGISHDLALPWQLAGNALEFYLTPLSNFFMLVISVICLAVSVFSYGYAREYMGKHSVGILGLLYNLFILTMLLLVASGSALMFLFFWEMMSLVSYLLVVYDHQDLEVRRAGFIYIVMTHMGTLFIVAAFMLLYRQAGSFGFGDFATAARDLPQGSKSLVFILVTLGFGTKAGIVPLHVWLPKAHPAAPSNISAIMSGVMLKTAVYGFLKIVVDVMGGGPEWWGSLLLLAGTLSALLGVMYALLEQDIKRLLAYSSVENIGIILMGIGAGLIFLAHGNKTLASVGFTAGLLHVFNHGVFKGLLFLGAGSIHYATGTRDMEKLGGLLKKMPWTGFFFLIGSLAISALPPFNGFISEWLTFQSLLLLGSANLNHLISIVSPLSGAGLALTGALAAACFVKAFGIQFLALPRSPHAEEAVEVPGSMKLGMGFLALLCLVSGIVPVTIIGLLRPVSTALVGVDTLPILDGYGWLRLPGQGSQTVLSSLVIFGILLLVTAIVVVINRLGGKKAVRVVETWNCGTELTPQMEYTAASFSKPIRIIFRSIFLPQRKIETEFILKPYFTASIKYKGSIKPVFEDTLYRPATRLFVQAANKVRLLQSGSMHLYLTYIFVTLVVVLVFAR